MIEQTELTEEQILKIKQDFDEASKNPKYWEIYFKEYEKHKEEMERKFDKHINENAENELITILGRKYFASAVAKLVDPERYFDKLIEAIKTGVISQ